MTEIWIDKNGNEWTQELRWAAPGWITTFETFNKLKEARDTLTKKPDYPTTLWTIVSDNDNDMWLMTPFGWVLIDISKATLEGLNPNDGPFTTILEGPA